MTNLRSTIFRRTAAWLVLAALISIILFNVQNVNELLKIVRDPLATTAAIISTECENHALVYYRYEVNGKAYFGKSSRTPYCNQLRAGNPIHIFYAADAPSISGISDPQKNLAAAIILIGVAATFFPTMIVFIVLARWKAL